MFDRDGNSISSAGDWPSSDQDICAAVAANIWLTLERATRVNPNQVQVTFMPNGRCKKWNSNLSESCLQKEQVLAFIDFIVNWI